MLKTIRWCFMGLCMAFANAQAAPILLVDASGELTGANGVDVGGTLYDVRFVDGSCIALFSGCDSVADFPFATKAGADEASQALLDQVLLGVFDDDPARTAGCEQPAGCQILTPYELFAGGAGLILSGAINSPVADFVSDVGTTPANDTIGADGSVYAVWTLPPTGTPLPGTLSCLGIGLLGLVLANRRRAQARCRTQ